MRDCKIDGLGSKILRIYKCVNAELLKDHFVFLLHELIVFNMSQGLSDSKFLGNRTRRDVAGLKRSDSNVEIGVMDSGASHGGERGCRAAKSHQIVMRVEGVQFLLIAIDENYVLILIA